MDLWPQVRPSSGAGSVFIVPADVFGARTAGVDGVAGALPAPARLGALVLIRAYRASRIARWASVLLIV
jgi:hypothetical protein